MSYIFSHFVFLQEMDAPHTLLQDSNSLFHELVSQTGPATSSHLKSLAHKAYRKHSAEGDATEQERVEKMNEQNKGNDEKEQAKDEENKLNHDSNERYEEEKQGIGISYEEKDVNNGGNSEQITGQIGDQLNAPNSNLSTNSSKLQGEIQIPDETDDLAVEFSSTGNSHEIIENTKL